MPVEVRWIKPDAVSPAAGLDVVTHRWPKVIGPILMGYSPMIEQNKDDGGEDNHDNPH
jgi:hypothetical protein